MKAAAVVILATAAFAASAFATPEVVTVGPVTVTKIREPRPELRFEVLVPGQRDSVWQAFTTGSGLNTWLWKDCSVDLRKGGGWMAHYPEGKSGGGTIENIKRGQEITLHAMAPEQFPSVRKVGTTARFHFEAVGDTATRVELRQTGWQSGEEWDRAYEYLAKGNAQLLGQLRYRFAHGPIDWEAAEKKQAQPPSSK